MKHDALYIFFIILSMVFSYYPAVTKFSSFMLFFLEIIDLIQKYLP